MIYAKYHNDIKMYPFSSFDIILKPINTYNQITELLCNDCDLTHLPKKLPDSLKCLKIDNNHLTFLPELPKTLTTLSCAHNKLTSLPKLPTTIQNLCVSHNYLEHIDIGSLLSLNRLDCSHNKLQSISIFHKIPGIFNFSNNKLSFLEFGNRLHFNNLNAYSKHNAFHTDGSNVTLLNIFETPANQEKLLNNLWENTISGLINSILKLIPWTTNKRYIIENIINKYHLPCIRCKKVCVNDKFYKIGIMSYRTHDQCCNQCYIIELKQMTKHWGSFSGKWYCGKQITYV